MYKSPTSTVTFSRDDISDATMPSRFRNWARTLKPTAAATRIKEAACRPEALTTAMVLLGDGMGRLDGRS